MRGDTAQFCPRNVFQIPSIGFGQFHVMFNLMGAEKRSVISSDGAPTLFRRRDPSPEFMGY
jgi:hypothetical protein